MSVLADEIRFRAAEFLDGAVSLLDFKHWFVPASWNVHQRNEPETERLAYDVDLLLVEVEEGWRTEADFKERLRGLISTIRAGYCIPPASPSSVTASASNVTLRIAYPSDGRHTARNSGARSATPKGKP